MVRESNFAGSNPSRRAADCNLGRVVYTHVSLSAGSIIWYQSMGGDARWLEGNRGPGGK